MRFDWSLLIDFTFLLKENKDFEKRKQLEALKDTLKLIRSRLSTSKAVLLRNFTTKFPIFIKSIVLLFSQSSLLMNQTSIKIQHTFTQNTRI